MKPEECAEKLGISIEKLFLQAYERQPRIFGTAGPVADLNHCRRWGMPPLYVVNCIKREERPLNAPTIDA